MCSFAAMKTDFQYSTDFYRINSNDLSHTCMHLLCLAGECSFVFNEHCYHIVKNDLVVIPMPDRVSNLAGHADLQVEWFAADYKFLQNLLPSNNYSIGGSISLNQDPVIKLSDEQALHQLEDFHRLRDRMGRPPFTVLSRTDGQSLPDNDVRHIRGPCPAGSHRLAYRPHGLHRETTNGTTGNWHQSNGT